MRKIETRGRIIKTGLGVLFVAAGILGGNTASDVNGDIITICTLALGLTALPMLKPGRIGVIPGGFAAAGVAAVLLQLLPLGGLAPRQFAGGVDSLFLTFDVIETVRALLTVVCVGIVLLVVLSLDYDIARSLTSFLYVGLICNLFVGALNYSASSNIVGDDLFPYALAGGFFINPNHFSTYLLMFVPFVVFEGVYRERVKFAVAILLFILVLLLAAKSLAGVSIAFLAMVLSGTAMLERRKLRWPLLAIVVMFAALYLYGLDVRIAAEGQLTDEMRLKVWSHTLYAISQNLLTGVGYGAFTEAYAAYEPLADIGPSYINHAHNEYLEMIYEGGALAALLIAAYGAALLRQTFLAWADPLKRCAAISILMLLITALVDYPSRTFAVLYLFAFANGILFHQGKRVKIPRSQTMAVTIDGVETRVPIARPGR
ncbi:O-antigen ligase family protein [Hansschlegelia plantiphila]|uniref:O-antigen ligase-related domain-containing protein n=1 Tax=Hansschlegelia plantiphila TaxID=374655 RepID=A0A9W6J2M3_9HYPH|nr:O-antigen ligase family protein [Hansschlegelia plantiphila]GLK69720.1 hypothetical protein GCM10008179_33580 [Hansschlegelia plantiphila]